MLNIGNGYLYDNEVEISLNFKSAECDIIHNYIPTPKKENNEQNKTIFWSWYIPIVNMDRRVIERKIMLIALLFY